MGRRDPRGQGRSGSPSRQQPGEPLRAVQRAGRVLHIPCPQTTLHADPAAQPVEVVAAEVGHVVDRVVEVRRRAALAPAVPAGRVVVARAADGEAEQVRPLEREVDRVVGAEADAERGELGGPAAVVVDERDDLVEDPGLVAAVLGRARLERQRRVRPRLAVEGVHAVELRAARLEQLAQRADHAAVAVLPGVAALGREREERAPPVAVGDDVPGRPDRRRVQLDVAAAHHALASSSGRYGSNASRQAV